MANKKIKFRLVEGRKPVSWELPLRDVFLPKLNPETNILEDKRVHYMPGAPSIWHEDYKGDKKESPEVVFEDGELEVSDTNHLLLEILRKHRWFNLHYEEVSEETDSVKKMNKIDNIQKALSMVDDTDDLKVRATALSLLGNQAFGYSVIKCKADLKEKAFNTPDEVIDEMSKPNYETKYLVSLALVKNIIKITDGNTSVVWGDSNGVIIRVPVGQDAIEETTKFLSQVNDDSAKITLQKIGTLAFAKASDSAPATEQSTVSDATTKVIEDLQKQNEALMAKLDALLADKASKDSSGEPDKAPVLEENTTDGPAKASEEEEENEEEDEDLTSSIEELRAKYLEAIGTEVPNPKKNDAIWIMKKIQEASQK